MVVVIDHQNYKYYRDKKDNKHRNCIVILVFEATLKPILCVLPHNNISSEIKLQTFFVFRWKQRKRKLMKTIKDVFLGSNFIQIS